MSVGPDYDGEFRRMIEANAAAVIPALEKREKWIVEKIEKAADRYGVAAGTISAALRECKVLRFYFAKDPLKQGMHEKAAAKYIRAIRGVVDFSHPPSGGKNALHIVGGRVVGTAELRAMRREDKQLTYSKSVDFMWCYGGKQFYAYHKFTGAKGGGAQGNQGNDVRTFLRESVPNKTPEFVFVALCDGGFYPAANGIMGKTRMDGIRGIAGEAKNGNVFAMTTGELPAFLRLKPGAGK